MKIFLVIETGDEDTIFAIVEPTKKQMETLELVDGFVLGRTPDDEMTPAIGKALLRVYDAFRETGPYNTLDWGGIWLDCVVDKNNAFAVDKIIHCGIL